MILPAGRPARPFAPPWWSRGGHRQTLLGFYYRRNLGWELPTEDVWADVAGDVKLLLRATWQPGNRADHPAVVLVHGLGGWDLATYGLSTGALAYSMGWHVVRMNMRGAGDSARVYAGLYNAGLDLDLIAALNAVAAHTPRIAIIGFSLGANLAVLALGRSGHLVPSAVERVVAVSPPLDLAACAWRLEALRNRAYQAYFMRNLRIAYRYRQTLRPDLFQPGAELGPRTVREWDQAITAPHGGYASGDEYYTRSSAGPYVAAVRTPTLILAAQDDPLIPGESVARWPLPASGVVAREMLPTGGHVGFAAPTIAPGRFWAAERAMAFLGGVTSRAAPLSP
jgi:predicted alpha/beta-fold hydrolase